MDLFGFDLNKPTFKKSIEHVGKFDPDSVFANKSFCVPKIHSEAEEQKTSYS